MRRRCAAPSRRSARSARSPRPAAGTSTAAGRRSSVLGAVGMPAHERLAADRAAARERQDRLVGEQQLVPGQRVAQAALDLQVRADSPGAGSRRTAPGGCRRRPSRGTSPRRPRAAWSSGSASGSCETDTPTLASIDTSAVPTWNGSSSACSTRSARASASRVALDFLGQDHELVAAQARDGVAVAHHLRQALGDGDQQAGRRRRARGCR